MLTAIAEGIWSAEDQIFMPGGIHFPLRMVVIRLPDGGLLLHSPVAIDEELARELAELGPVRHLVAPSKLHHLHLASAAERYPQAVVWGAPGLAEKQPELPIDAVLGQDDAPWSDSLLPRFIDGLPWMNETVFLHRPSASLVVTDLFFHITAPPNLRTRLLMWMMGVLGKPKQSLMVRLQTKDKAAAAAAARVVAGWDIQRAVPAHGAVIERDARAQIAGVLQPMIRRGGLPLVEG